MPSVRRFEASVTYRDLQGQIQEEAFPIHARDFETANRMAFAYVLAVLKLEEFELRLVGA